jgi:hypothetical protein
MNSGTRVTLDENAAVRKESCVRLVLWTLAVAILLASKVCARVASAQESASPSGGSAQQESLPARALPELAQVQTRQNPKGPCIEPAPGVSWRDYQGPYAKTVGIFARKLERRTVHDPHYKAGAALCTLEVKDKFILFVEDTLDPATFLSAGFNAGISQAENDDHSYGQGAEGYGKRFGANMAGAATSGFFKDFAYPTIFAEDPRYYRLGEGNGGKRFFHAVEHSYLAHRENGRNMVNFSEWLGTASAVVLSNTYHPDNRRGFSPAAQRVGYSVASDIGYDLLREFWPEIARKFKLPFRDREAVTRVPGPEKQ